MLSLSNIDSEVKEIESDVFPGGGDRATVETDLSTLSALSGNVSLLLCPEWAKAENSGGEAESEGAKPPFPTSLDSYRHISAFGRQSLIYRAFIDAGEFDKADSFLKCGKDVYTLECESCGYTHPVRYNCKLRLCPRCASAKMRLYLEKYLPYVQSLKLGSLRKMHLTIKNVQDLAAGVVRIRDAFTKLRHRAYYSKRILGGLYGIEAKPGKDGLWNVHIHCLYRGQYIPQDRLSDDWEAICKDSRVTFISRVDSPRGALMYVLKYVTKGVESDDEGWTPENLVEFVIALRDVRLVQAFGCFLGQVADLPPFACPRCGYILWKVIDVVGVTVYSPLGVLLRDFKSRSP